MTVYRMVSYDDQDDGHILKAARKQKCIMFDELKTELNMKTKKEEDEDDVQFFSLNVPIDAADKDSKTYTVKVRKYDMGSPDDFSSGRQD
jgi:hypothetical protein